MWRVAQLHGTNPQRLVISHASPSKPSNKTALIYMQCRDFNMKLDCESITLQCSTGEDTGMFVG
jgi:hypothetical protein